MQQRVQVALLGEMHAGRVICFLVWNYIWKYYQSLNRFTTFMNFIVFQLITLVFPSTLNFVLESMRSYTGLEAFPSIHTTRVLPNIIEASVL